MVFTSEARRSELPFVDAVWRAQSERSGSFTSVAVCQTELVITRQEGKATLVLRGPETRATLATCPAGAEFYGITFKMGVFMPALPPVTLVDRHHVLPVSTRDSFWLGDRAWAVPENEDIEDFIERLFRQRLLRVEPMVERVLGEGGLGGESPGAQAGVRTLQRRFQQATGLSYRTVRHIERTRTAAALLQQGAGVLDVVHELGYSDQPHLTKALRQLMGRTPARVADPSWAHSPLLASRELGGLATGE